MAIVWHLVRRSPSCRGADVAILKRPLGHKGDLDRLFAGGGHGGAVLGILGEMDDPEPDLRFRPGAGSHTVTDGEPALFQGPWSGLTPSTGLFHVFPSDTGSQAGEIEILTLEP